jgi:hypothetical protein
VPTTIADYALAAVLEIADCFAEREIWIERWQMFEEELDDLQQMLADATDDNEIRLVKEEIGQTEKVLKISRRALGEGK